VANLLNPETDQRRDILAALHVGKTLPFARDRHHAEILHHFEYTPWERDNYVFVPLDQRALLLISRRA